MIMIAALLATLAAGLFAGAALYVSLVEHPARLRCGTRIGVAEFGPSYRRAAVMQATLAVIGSVAALGRWWTAHEAAWLVGGALLAAVIPFTLIAIRPTNERLLSSTLDSASAEAAGLLRRWGRLHAVRTASSVVAFAILLTGLGRAR